MRRVSFSSVGIFVGFNNTAGEKENGIFSPFSL